MSVIIEMVESVLKVVIKVRTLIHFIFTYFMIICSLVTSFVFISIGVCLIVLNINLMLVPTGFLLVAIGYSASLFSGQLQRKVAIREQYC